MTDMVNKNFIEVKSVMLSQEVKIAFGITMFGLFLKIFLSSIGLIEYSFNSLVFSFFKLPNLSSILSFASVMVLCTKNEKLGRWIWGGSGLICLLALVIFTPDFIKNADKNTTIIVFTQGLLSFLLLIYRSFTGESVLSRQHAKEKYFLILILAIVSIYGFGVVSITSALSPLVYDAILYQFDGSLGFSASTILSSLVQDYPLFLNWIIKPIYLMLPLGMGLQYVQQMQSKEPAKVYLLLFWFSSMFIVCLFSYLLLPATGPKYIFTHLFPNNMPPLTDIMNVPLVNPVAYPRNAFPSMHFGWAFAMWLNAILMKGKLQTKFFLVITILTALATLSLGEHYLIDLIVAVPFTYALQGIFLRGLPLNHTARWQCILVGTALWLAWVVALRTGIEVFIGLPWLSWGAVLFSLVSPTFYYRKMVKAQNEWFNSPASIEVPVKADKIYSNLKPIYLMFIFSGFSGLIYEVVFSKELALIFGSSSIATYTVLATYMGGMALGAALGGMLNIKRPLIAYIACEMLIGVYCIITPFLFKFIQYIYLHLATGLPPDVSILTFYRLALGCLLLLPPTLLMGATMPLLLAYCREKHGKINMAVANLYAANTIGAAFGALLAGYFILPALGIALSTAIAAAINFAVAFMALQIFKKNNEPIEQEIDFGIQSTPMSSYAGVEALIVLFLGGVITLALEVKYMFLLAVVAGNSTYAFSLMLFTFLLGLAAGAILIKPWIKPNNLLAILEFILAAVILLGVFSWESMPAYFASFANYPSAKEFGAREFIRGLVCFCAMFPPALIIGAIYPVAMAQVASAFPANPVRALGLANALNTSGNIIGVLCASFIMLPVFGALYSIQILAAVAFVLGVMLSIKKKVHIINIAMVVFVLGAFYIQPKSFDYSALATGANVYFAPQNEGQVIDHAESIDGGLTTVILSKDHHVKILLTNGKFQGNNSVKGEMQAQTGFALAPLLHTDARERALVIGYGTGATSRVLDEAGFNNLDIVDLSADIVRLANQHFHEINKNVSKKPRVNTYITDGRNYLLLTDKKYDLIGMEITSIWFAGAASLYNQEFYALAKSKLKPDGVLQQWVQLHHTKLNDLLSILASVRSDFKYVWLYEIGGQGIIVASNDSKRQPLPSNADLIANSAGMQEVLSIYQAPVHALLHKILLTPASLERFLMKVSSGDPAAWISTDNNLYLEYETPKGNVLDGGKSLSSNLELIKKFSGKE
ncbi:fused MFS/spermidine synthase [Iodobacter sp.]|uniref:fused MFS/spermidine synthase n=1 Tax=Iodobacter sp. TaxID=1915058 RepID=UPI0025E12ECA|nr:fused MFS/spermidine synthase [Iodobacter sp.]